MLGAETVLVLVPGESRDLGPAKPRDGQDDDAVRLVRPTPDPDAVGYWNSRFRAKSAGLVAAERATASEMVPSRNSSIKC